MEVGGNGRSVITEFSGLIWVKSDSFCSDGSVLSDCPSREVIINWYHYDNLREQVQECREYWGTIENVF